MTEREFSIDVIRTLQEAGFEALWAGGCVRDEQLGLLPKDYDVATSALPDQVMSLFRRTIAVGASFGVVEVIGPRCNNVHLRVQVATFRSDVSYSDGRRPDKVVFSSAREDALRRDFTVNGMFYDPIANKLYDYVGGREDLRNRILRCIGDPFLRFAEDKLRLLRAVRIATRFHFTIEEKTAQAIRAMANGVSIVSAERIAEELRRLLTDLGRAQGMMLMDDLGLVGPIFPELLPLKQLPSNDRRVPVETCWAHTLEVLDALEDDAPFTLAMAALLHQVGKGAQSNQSDTDGSSFEHRSAKMARDIATRLRLSNFERDRIVWLIANQHALRRPKELSLAELKELLRQPGIQELLSLHRADALARMESTEHVEFCEQLLQSWTQNDLAPPELITGTDLMKEFSLKPGPLFKELLDAIRTAQLNEQIFTRDEALAMVKKLLAEK